RLRVGGGRVPALGRGAAGRGPRQARVPADRRARGLRRRAGRVRELLRLRRGDGEAGLTPAGDPGSTTRRGTWRCRARRAGNVSPEQVFVRDVRVGDRDGGARCGCWASIPVSPVAGWGSSTVSPAAG